MLIRRILFFEISIELVDGFGIFIMLVQFLKNYKIKIQI